MNDFVETTCQCRCGVSKVILSQTPRKRFYCHCVTCQEVYGLPFADVVIVRATSLTLDKDAKVEYKNYSPNLDRGICMECQSPVVSFLKISSSLKIGFVPTASLDDRIIKPKSTAHIYYHSAIAPVSDDIPKVRGPIKSNLRVLPSLMIGLFGR